MRFVRFGSTARTILRGFLTLALSLSPLSASAQTTPAAPNAPNCGVIGKVVSSETGEPLGFASVGFISETAAAGTPEAKPKGGIGKGDGSFRVALPPGSYRAEVQYISYQLTRISNVVVKDGEWTTLNLSLTPSAIQLKAVEVTAQEVRNAESAILSKRKKAMAASDGISAEQIRKSADGNVAEVATRVTGVSVVGDKYVYIRGLGERYNSTLLNGATIATPEPERRVVPLDLFPSDLVDNLVVQKAYTPDLPGEFAGGAVDINTREFPGKRTFSFSASTGYNSETTSKDFQTYNGGKRDALGFDDGTRKLPDIIEQLASNQPIKSRGVASSSGFPADTLEIMAEAFGQTWTPEKKQGSPAFNFGASYADQHQFFGRDLGIFAGGSLKNSFQTFGFEKNVFESRAADGLLTSTATYDGASSEREVLWGSLLHASYRMNDAHTLSVRSMYDRSAEDEVRTYEGFEGDTSQRLIRDTRFLFVERGLFSGSVETDHSFRALHDSKAQLRYSYSQSERNEPDRREYVYEFYEREVEDEIGNIDTLRVWELSQTSPDRSFTRLFSNLDDIERSVDGHWTTPFPFFNGLEAKVKAGVSHKNKDRDFFLRRFTFNQPLASTRTDLSLPPESLMVDSKIAGSRFQGFQLEERTRNTDNYRGSQNLTAEYLMVDVPLTSKARMVTGARVETSKQSVLTEDILYKTEDTIRSELKTTDVLPSVNMTYAVTSGVNARASYSRTLARPELREIAPYSISNYQGDFEEEGNPDLKRSIIHNYDLRLEYFPGANEVVAVSGFYKNLVDPIEKSIQGGDDPVYKPINGQGGHVQGLEFESRVGLGRISPSIRTLGINSNLTLVESETELDALGIQFSNKRPLEGQSSYVANVGLSFVSEKDRTQVSLLYNVFGKRLRYVGFGTLPDVYEQPRQNLDLTVNHSLGGARFKIAAENLLDSESRFEQNGQITDLSRKGRGFSVSLAYGSR